MPPTQTDEGLRAAQQIRREMPGVGVMVLSQYIDEGYAVELLQGSAEGVGYLLKDRVADIDAFTDALRRVGEGGSVLDPEVVSQLLGRRRADDPLDRLTPREREVLGQMAQGRSNGADRPRARRHRARDREARHEHLLEARPVVDRGRPPPRARRAALPRRQLNRLHADARGSGTTTTPRPGLARRRPMSSGAVRRLRGVATRTPIHRLPASTQPLVADRVSRMSAADSHTVPPALRDLRVVHRDSPTPVTSSLAPQPAAVALLPDRRRLTLRLALIVAVLGAITFAVASLPGLGDVRDRLAGASPGWLALALALEAGSCLACVVAFRGVFCRRMPWRLSYEIAIAAQGTNVLLPSGGAGGLAVAAWALRRTGMSADRIGRRTVAFYVLTSGVNFATAVLAGGLLALGVLAGGGSLALSAGPALAALVAIATVVALPRLLASRAGSKPRSGRAGRVLASMRGALDGGIRDAGRLVRAATRRSSAARSASCCSTSPRSAPPSPRSARCRRSECCCSPTSSASSAA